jgi:hypothetical protein
MREWRAAPVTPLKLNVPQQRVLVMHRPDVLLWDEQHDARVSSFVGTGSLA